MKTLSKTLLVIGGGPGGYVAAIRAATELPERQQRIFAGCARGETLLQIAQDLGIDESTCRRDLKLAILEIQNKIGLKI